MNTHRWSQSLAGCALALGAVAVPAQEQVIVRAGSLLSAQGPQQNFIGKVRVDPVFTPNEHAPYSMAYVTFEPGARSAWHVHPAGQRLVVTAGVGRSGTWGEQYAP